MTKAIEVVYENNVFKPLGPIEGIEEHERMVAIFSRRPDKKQLRNLSGTITHDEAQAMQKCIDEEFEKIEGSWQISVRYQRGNRLPGRYFRCVQTGR